MSYSSFVELLEIRDVHDGGAIKEFIEEALHNHPKINEILPALSNIYVLVATKNIEYRSNGNDWRCVLERKAYEKNRIVIIGYVWIESGSSKIDYIKWIDSLIKGNNIANMIITKYELLFNKILIPQEIPISSVIYWKRYLDQVYGIETKEELDDLVSRERLNVKWTYLYMSYEPVETV